MDCNMLFTFGYPHLLFTQYLYKSGFHCTNATDDATLLRGFIRSFAPHESTNKHKCDRKLKNKHQAKDVCPSVDCRGVKSHTFQLIPVEMDKLPGERSPSRRLINASYDLDICKSYFNGRDLFVRSWKKLIYKFDYIKCNMRYVMRYYEEAPYDCGCLNACECDNWKFHIDMAVTESRMAKYISRGFDIKLHPRNDEIIKHVILALEPNGDQPNTSYDRFKYIENGSINLDNFYLE